MGVLCGYCVGMVLIWMLFVAVTVGGWVEEVGRFWFYIGGDWFDFFSGWERLV